MVNNKSLYYIKRVISLTKGIKMILVWLVAIVYVLGVAGLGYLFYYESKELDREREEFNKKWSK